jgi:cytosine deaminase
MDLVLKNARLPGRGDALADIAISSGKIAVIEPNIATVGPVVDAGGRLVSSGFIETHIHLDKSCILDRCNSTRGDLEESIGEAGKAKANFTPEDVHARATRTLEKAILQGTTHMRTHPIRGSSCAVLKGCCLSFGTTPGQSIFRFAFSPRRVSSTTQARTNSWSMP